jgi:hypothetical protein
MSVNFDISPFIATLIEGILLTLIVLELSSSVRNFLEPYVKPLGRRLHIALGAIHSFIILYYGLFIMIPLGRAMLELHPLLSPLPIAAWFFLSRFLPSPFQISFKNLKRRIMQGRRQI